MFRSAPADLLVILVIVLLFFGPKRLPSLGRSLGSGIREFKDGISSKSSDHDEDEQPEQIASGSGTGESGRPS
jgi:sec-independent protein translocase protein TatA